MTKIDRKRQIEIIHPEDTGYARMVEDVAQRTAELLKCQQEKLINNIIEKNLEVIKKFIADVEFIKINLFMISIGKYSISLSILFLYVLFLLLILKR